MEETRRLQHLYSEIVDFYLIGRMIMAIYAFDGTGNKDNPGDGEDSNVLKFFNAYKQDYLGKGKCFYVEGVGTEDSFKDKIFGSLFGSGGHKRIEEATKALEENFRNGDTRIDIVGFSRGAALALEFANRIHDDGVDDVENPPISFIGIWDTVASFGLPGNHINVGYTLSIPSNAAHCFHAIALDERRQGFPLTRVNQDTFSDTEQLKVQEVWFRGFHSDIGGGNFNQKLSSISLVWMFHRGMEAGIGIPEEHIEKHAALRDPDAKCKKPGMDVFPNKRRLIQHTDIVHDSVTRREMAATKFKANNPPKGLSVTGDSSSDILDKGFER
jgi:uncharacterized protein (DUF2235 family)